MKNSSFTTHSLPPSSQLSATSSQHSALSTKLVNAGIEQREAKKEISILVSEFQGNIDEINKIVDERIRTRKPLQYLLGKAYFMDFEVKVRPNVFIPRRETEILVEETVKRLLPPNSLLSVPSSQLLVLDIGTGSGVISIALVKMVPNIKIIAIDIEKRIIDIAKENAQKNHVEKNIEFKVCDLFSDDMDKLFKENLFDVMISNPPYVSSSKFLQPELLHEGISALFGTTKKKSPLVYYQRIFRLAKKYFSGTSWVALEIDPPLLAPLKKLLKKYNLENYEIVKDYSKLDRCLFVSL